MAGSRVSFLFAGLLLLAATSLALGALLGSVPIEPAEILAVLAGQGDPVSRAVILELRLPRTLSAFAVGGLLALAGTLMQVLLRNPLADPYVLGVSGGAAVAALIAISMGLGSLWIDLGAFGGALLISLLVFTLAHGPGGWTPARLLLTGIVVASGLAAVISLLLALGDDSSLRGMLFWLMGDLSYAVLPWWSLAVLGGSFILTLGLARSLNVLAMGETTARLLGEPTRQMLWLVYLLASVLTATAVSIAGSIGFVGLIVPHLMRLLVGSDHRILIPAATLFGGLFLVLSDTLARTILSPQQLPVGVITALLGVPLFLLLLNRARLKGV